MFAQGSNRDEDTTLSSSSFVLSNSSDNEEEGEEVNQLVLNMRRRGTDLVDTLEVPATEPILVLSSNLEDSNDLAFVPL